MRIKIISEDGISNNTIFILENGMELANVAEANIRFRVGKVVEAELRFLLPGISC